MKKNISKLLAVVALVCATTALSGADNFNSSGNTSGNMTSAAQLNAKSIPQGSALKIGVVNFKRIVESSKYGKEEQAHFETLKKQMESVLEEKDKTLNEIAAKLDDPDYTDSLSPEAENELKHKFRNGSQELGQIQGQYYQALSQANGKILQKLSDMVADASNQVAKEQKLDLILSEESSFFFSPALDISHQVIAAMDVMFDKEAREKQK